MIKVGRSQGSVLSGRRLMMDRKGEVPEAGDSHRLVQFRVFREGRVANMDKGSTGHKLRL